MIEYSALIDNGILGIMLGWFMFRMEKVLNKNTEALINVKETIHKCTK